MQFNILCVLTLLVAFVASAAVPEAAPDVTSTYGTWFDVEDFDLTNFKLATRDEGLCLSVSVDMASLFQTGKN
ncbi:short chain dehydrogenase family protein [Aspergillus niger]|uniref:Short chain dehydrogenase family protein n=1 Tax=Aspergillus niger TaxID=5061 RepID=A0A505IEC4_ASPNG|nr:short chain dehydrogenase family protein [Aspergillus niger]